MNTNMRVLITLCLVSITTPARADNYSVSVSRKDSNVYSFTSGSARGVIITKYCYEYGYAEDAVLKYEPYSYDNKLIFTSSGTVCDVESVFTK